MNTNDASKTGFVGDFMKADLDDLIFQYRNKEYGAYQLRKAYYKRMTRGTILAILLLAFAAALPSIVSFIRDKVAQDETLNVEVTLSEPPSVDPKQEPPPPPPPVEPPPARPTIAFTIPVVKKDEEVVEEVPPPTVEEMKDVEISTKTQEGSDDGVVAGLGDEPIEEAPPEIIKEVEPPKPTQEVFKVVEQMPSFPDGQAALLRYLAQNIEYPTIAKENGVEGMVVVQFVVERDGSIAGANVVKGIGAGCDEEALRVVRSMPKWQPGKQRGQPVRVQFNLPIRFKLE
jgi:protein TonB